MSIAAKCTCGKSAYHCNGKGDCLPINTFKSFTIHYNCTAQEINKLRAFLFALRHKDSDMDMIEKIISKYDHLIN